MKKAAVMLLLLCIPACCFSACSRTDYYYDFGSIKHNAVAVELIDYGETEAEGGSDKNGKAMFFDNTKLRVLETMEPDRVDAFIDEFYRLKFLIFWREHDLGAGRGIRIIYEYGDYIVATYKLGYACRFYADGSLNEIIGGNTGKTFIDLSEKYFQ